MKRTLPPGETAAGNKERADNNPVGFRQAVRIPPLYKKDGETVFELQAMPGRYELYRIV